MRFQFNITKQRKCRLCSSDLEHVILDLGPTPLSNSFLKTKSEKEFVFPLKVYFCTNCFLVQIQEYENPEKIFLNYPYFSSYSETWLEHCKNYVNMVIEKFGFDTFPANITFLQLFCLSISMILPNCPIDTE